MFVRTIAFYTHWNNTQNPPCYPQIHQKSPPWFLFIMKNDGSSLPAARQLNFWISLVFIVWFISYGHEHAFPDKSNMESAYFFPHRLYRWQTLGGAGSHCISSCKAIKLVSTTIRRHLWSIIVVSKWPLKGPKFPLFLKHSVISFRRALSNSIHSIVCLVDDFHGSAD